MKRQPRRNHGIKLAAERLEDRSLLAVLFAHDADDPVRAIAPSEADYDRIGLDWLGGSEPFDDSAWEVTSGAANGVGYDRGTTYDPLLGLDLEASMYAARSTMFVRAAFEVDDPAEVERLTLNLRYDDGFIAWLNGVEVARANAVTIYPLWDATATAGHEASPSAFDTFDLAAHIDLLRAGTNILAVRGLNVAVRGDDALVQFTLVGESRTGPPLAVDDVATTEEGVPVAIDVLANDEEGAGAINPASVVIASPPAHGTAVANADGTITYTPNPVYNGPDTFTYTVRDGIGVGQPRTETLISPTAAARALVPANNALGTTWRGGNEPFNDSAWQAGTFGVGYESSSGYEPYIGLNVGGAMQGVNTSVYVRSTFALEDPANVTALTLRMRYDDGFAAFLNGVQVAAAQAPAELSSTSAATADHADTLAVQFEAFDITSFAGALRAGTNVLAIHGLNIVLASSDMLVQPELTATIQPRGQVSNAATVTVNVTGVDYPPIARDDVYSTDEGQTLTADQAVGGNSPTLGPGQFAWSLAQGGNGHVYERVVQAGNWTQARDAAASRSFSGVPGHLATFTSAAEWDFIKTHISGDAFTWLGGFQDRNSPNYAEPGGGWTWVTGEPWTFTYWAPGEPNGGTSEDHLVTNPFIVAGDPFRWMDNPSTSNYGAMLVEYPTSVMGNSVESLVAASSDWLYHDTGQRPAVDAEGDSWKEDDYNDMGWASGPAQLGYGDGDEATLVNCGPTRPACNNNYITTWFRKHFQFEPGSAARVESLDLGLLVDDGASVYINGVEVARTNLPGDVGDDGIDAATVALAALEATSYLPFIVDLALPRFRNLLHDGDNVIAVEVHQAGANSSDISFDLRLDANIATGLGVLVNDTEPDEQAMTAVLETPPASGVLDLDPDGTFTYTPNPGFVGVDTFTYRASDGTLTSNPATVTITVNHTAPSAAPDSYTTDESTPLVVAAAEGVLVNDTDTQGHALTATMVTSPSHGSVALNADGSFTYTPTPGYNGLDTFAYTASDGTRSSAAATVTITINSVNSPPVAVGDVFSVVEGFALGTVQTGTIKVLNTGYDQVAGAKLADNANDTDFAIGQGSAVGVGSAVRAARTGLPSPYVGDSASAASSWIAMAAIDQPAGSYFFDTTVVVPGGDASAVRLGNLRYATDNKLVSIFVNSTEVFTQPLGDAEEFRSFQSLGNLGLGAFGPGVNTIRFEVYNGGGAMALRVEGVVDYDPTAVPGVLANDTDVDSSTLTARAVSQPEHGALEFNADGTFRYTPNAGFVGVDTFTYVANDGESDSNVAAVTIDVLHAPPTANADAYAIAEDGTLDVSAAQGVLGNDTDTQEHPLSAALVTGPANGSLTLRADGSFTYSPAPNHHGTDSFTYRASDGTIASEFTTVTIAISSVNDVPTAGDDAYQTFANAPLTVPTTPVYVKNIATGIVNATLTKQSDLSPDDDYRIGAGSAGHVGATPVARQSGFGPYLVDAASAGSRWLIFDDAPEGTHYFDVQVDLTGFAAAQAFVRGLRYVADNRLISIAVNDTIVFSQPTSVADEMSAWRALGDVGLGAFRPGANTIRFGVHNSPDLGGINPLALRVEGIVVAPPIATDPTASLGAGLVQHWKFDETTGNTAEDSQGSNDLTLFNWTAQETKWTAGRIGGALAFDGNNSYAISAAPISLPRYSFSFWLRVDARTGINPRILGPANDHWILQNNEYARGVGFYYNNGNSLAQDPSEPVLGQWDHYAVTYERALNSAIVYRNGIRVGSGNASRSQPTSALWVLGHNGDGNNHTDSLNGRLDDVRVYDRILTPVEAALLAGVDTFVDPGFLANDGDADGDPLSVVLASLPANGVLAPGRPGAFTYTPNPGFVGTDSFTYRVSDGQALSNVATVTIEVVAPPPVTASDTYTLDEDAVLDVAAVQGVLANDSDALARPLSAVLVAGPIHGVLILDADGGFRYTPDEHFFGEDSFIYRATAGADASSDTIARITVVSVNDAPVAGDDEFAIDRGTSLVLAAPGTAVETIASTGFAEPATGAVDYAGGSELGFLAATTPGNTELGVLASDEYIVRGVGSPFTLGFDEVDISAYRQVGVRLDLRAHEDSSGSDFEDTDFFRATLGLSRIGGPVVLQTIVDLNGAELKAIDTGLAGAFTTYTASIPEGFIAATLTIETLVDSSSERVFFDNIAFTGVSATGGNVLLANDADDDGDELSVRIVSQPAHGAIVTDGDGAMTYTPEPLFVGTDTFTYVASDGTADSNVATVTVRVLLANLVPAAVDDAYDTDEDGPLVVSAENGLLANDVDLDDDPLAVSVVDPPSHGSVSVMPDGSFTYTPAGDFFGSDSFTYVANDGRDDSNVATVTIAIAAVNDPPAAVDDAYTVPQGGVLDVTGIGGQRGYAEVVLDANPLAYWRLDEMGGATAVDEAGAFHGTYQGGYTLGAAGAIADPANTAAEFNGTSGFVDVGYRPALNLRSDFSISAWIWLDDISEDHRVVANPNASMSTAGFAFGVVDGRLRFTAYVAQDYDTNPVIAAGRWYHVAVVFDASYDATFYVNGQFLQKIDGVAPAYSSASPFKIGAGSRSFWDGRLDEVAIFAHSLSAAQIAAQYAAGIGDGFVPEQSQFVARNSTWRYRDDITNGSAYPVDAQGDLWNDGDYDDSGWPAGPAMLGYGDIVAGPINTTIGYGPNASDKYRTALFRRTFEVESAERVVSLSVDALFDDGAAIYINGREVLRYNLPGTVGDNSLRTDTFTTTVGPEDQYQQFAVDLAAFPGLLVDGTNTIAVEVHQTDPSSSDLGFDLALTATTLPDPQASGVLGNDTDVEDDDLAAELVAGPQHGTLDFNAAGTFTYTPAPSYHGNDSFTYRAFDGTAYSNVATVNIVVTRRLVAIDDAYAIAEDTLLAVPRLQGVLANDPDAAVSDGTDPAVTAVIASAPANGTVTLAANGAFHYRPDANFAGEDTFMYRVTDGIIASEPATVTITVSAVNDAPTTSRDVYETDVGEVLETRGGTTPPFVPTTTQFIWPISEGGNGHVYERVTFSEAWDTARTLAAASTVLGVSGHLATITSAAEQAFFNSITTLTNTAGWLGGRQNANAPGYSEPAGGWTWLTQEPWSFTNWASGEPNDSSSADSAVYIAADGANLSWNDRSAFDQLPYWIEYPTAIVDAPRVELVGRNAIWRYRDGIVNGAPYPTDGEGDSWTDGDFDDASWPTGGAILGYGGISAGPTVTTIRIAPDGGQTSITALFRRAVDVIDAYRVASLTFDGVFDDGAAIYVNGREILRQNLPGSVGDGTLTTNTLTVSTGDESRYREYTVDLAEFPDLLVEGTNVVAVEVHQVTLSSSDIGFDMAITAAYSPDSTAGGVLGNDSDAEGDAITAAVVAGPYHGTLAFESDGTFTYMPNAGFEGVDQFTYRASDGLAESAATLVTINVGDANEAPLAADDRYVARGGGSLTVAAASGVLRNDFDANGDALAATVFAPPARGALALAADGGFVYTPQSGFFGVDTFTYRAADDGGTFGFATATIHVVPQVDPINGVPLAGGDAFAAGAGAVLGVLAPGVLVNDSDPEQRPLVAVVERLPWHGSLSFAADGSFTYTPRPGFLGEDSFAYRATDGNTFSPPATVTLNVAPVVIHGGMVVPTLPDSTLSKSTSTGSRPSFADVNGDGRVDRADFAAVVAAYGSATSPLAFHWADVDRDGRVSLRDAVAVRNAMSTFGETSYAAGSVVGRAAPRLAERNGDRVRVEAVRNRAEGARRPLVAAAVDTVFSEEPLSAGPRRMVRTTRVLSR
ncbi:MAG: hypothetical protein DCC68_20750 [Planctomycetota bacterium]|nr:MAG: hypothetical protein DCC68_20750 [Planctomycetota bacterium]